MLYLSIIILLSLLSYKYDYCQKNIGKMIWYNIVILCLIIIAGLRYRIGVDSIRYELFYVLQPDILEIDTMFLNNNSFGYGWNIFASIAKTISSSYYTLQFIQACYVNILLSIFIKRYSTHIFFSLLIYFIFVYTDFMYEILREACAVSTFTLAFKYLVLHKWNKYYIICCFAALFHTSALITFLVPIAFISGVKNLFIIKKRIIITLMVVYVIASVIGKQIFENLMLFNLIDSIQDKAVSYYYSIYSEARQMSPSGLIALIINRILYPFCALYLCKQSKTISDSKELIALEVMIILYALYSITSLPILIFNRFTNYFIPFVIIVISNWVYSRLYITKRIKIKPSFIVWMMLITPYLAIQTRTYFQLDGRTNQYRIYRYYPYTSILSKKEYPEREEIIRYYTL